VVIYIHIRAAQLPVLLPVAWPVAWPVARPIAWPVARSVVLPRCGLPLILAIAIRNAWVKLDKYYNMTDRSVAYVAAIVLNSAYKWKYFEKH
jgi:hypothetical protein